MNTHAVQSPSANRPVVVVLGSGRSGTSLLMQVLGALGMELSDTLIEARRDNPEGFYEDARIVKIQADLLRSLGAWPFHPLPPDWLSRAETATAGEALRVVLREHTARPGIWGFKDPRTASFLPLLQRLFAEEGIAPKYILALRDPGKIIRSFMQAYDVSAQVAEAVWLRRTCDALWHTGGECHIVHYEDWFDRPREVAAGLACHIGLPEADASALPAIVRPDLDRAGQGFDGLHTQEARALHGTLEDYRGSVFNRDELLRAVSAYCTSLSAS